MAYLAGNMVQDASDQLHDGDGPRAIGVHPDVPEATPVVLQSVGGRCAAKVAKRCDDAGASKACSSVLLALLRFERLAFLKCARNKVGQCCRSLWRAQGAPRWD